MGHIKESEDLNTAIIHTFLEFLAAHPDTFIARKVGVEKAKEVSAMAGAVLMHGGLRTVEGRRNRESLTLH